jgi:hypothetical protein
MTERQLKDNSLAAFLGRAIRPHPEPCMCNHCSDYDRAERILEKLCTPETPTSAPTKNLDPTDPTKVTPMRSPVSGMLLTERTTAGFTLRSKVARSFTI